MVKGIRTGKAMILRGPLVGSCRGDVSAGWMQLVELAVWTTQATCLKARRPMNARGISRTDR